jgi:iron(III) transport system substrate-binding protein
MTTRRTILKASLGLASSAAFVPFHARSAEEISPNLALADYTGSDRAARILAAAKKEGQVNFYTTIAKSDLEPLFNPFEKKYGVKVNTWRAGDEQVVQRAVSEARAGRYMPDNVHVGSSFLDNLRQENLLQPVVSPMFADLIPGSVPEHRMWASTLLSVWVQSYNTDVIKKENLPSSFDDLLLPKWKGKLGIESKSSDWFATICLQMGTEKGIAFFRELIATNGVSVRNGNSLLNNMVASGEVPLALETYNYMPMQAKRKNAPIDWFLLQPAVARANGIALFKHAPHPAAGMLLYDYMLSLDAQKILVNMDYVPTHRSVPSSFQNSQITPVDPAMSAAERNKWNNLFNHLFLS